MIPGVRGRLVSATFARDLLPWLPGFAPMPTDVAVRLAAWSARLESTLGTASSVRAVADIALVPLAALLGLECVERLDSSAKTFAFFGQIEAAGLHALAGHVWNR